MPLTFRYICMLVLLLAFGLGPPMPGSQASDMAAEMISATGVSMPMPDDCGSCGDDAMSPAVCMAACIGSIPATLPVKVTIALWRPAGPVVFASSASTGTSPSPDPHPPRNPTIA